MVGLAVFGFASAEVQNGSEAPAFSLKNLAGETVSLSDFKGKTDVLEWSNPDCPFVKKFYKPGKMQEWQKSTTEAGGVWLTINSSAKGKSGYYSASEMATKLENSGGYNGSAYLLDTDGKVGKTYGAKTTPHIYIIDKEGNLAYQGAIDSKKSVNAADIDEATNYIVKTLAALESGDKVSPDKTKPYGCSVKY